MSQRSLRSSVRQPATPAIVDTDSDASDDNDENVSSSKYIRSSGRGAVATRGRRGRPKKKLLDYAPPPTPGSHPSEEDEDMEATPIFQPADYSEEDDEEPPPTPGYMPYETRLGAPVPSLVPSSISSYSSELLSMDIDLPPPTPCPVGDGRETPPFMSSHTNMMMPPPTPRMASGSDRHKKISSSAPAVVTMIKSKQVKSGYKVGVTFTMDEMIQTSVLYFLVMQAKKIPVKRTEIIKQCMNGQSKDFSKLIDTLSLIFQDVFGINVVGLKEGGVKSNLYVSYILTSKYCLTLSASVILGPPDNNYKRVVLFLILTSIFMMNRGLSEEVIWKILSEMGLHVEVGVKKIEDLRRFIKSEYVSPMYLAMEEVKSGDANICRYSWGLRAEKEFSKYEILKFVAQQFPEKRPQDYAAQYARVMQHEMAAIERDRAQFGERNGEAEGRNSSRFDEALTDEEDNLPSASMRSSGRLRGRRGGGQQPSRVVQEMEIDDSSSD